MLSSGVALRSAAMTSLAIAGGWLIVASAIPMSATLLVAGGAVALLLVIMSDRLAIVIMLCFFTVVAANSAYPQFVTAAFFLRFAMYGLLIVFIVARRRVLRLHPPLLPIALAGLVLLSEVSAIWSPEPFLTLQRSTGLALLLGAAFLFGSSASARELKDALRLSVLGVSLVMVVGLLLVMTGMGTAYTSDGSRFRGILVNPNSVGLTVALSLPLALSYWSEAKTSVRLLWGGVLGVLVLSLLLSRSRGGVVSVVVGFAVFLLKEPLRTRTKVLLAGCMVVVATASAFMIAPELQPAAVREVVGRLAGEGETSSGSGRLESWVLALDTWAERPLSGWGFGTSESVFGPRAIAIQDVFVGESPHNVFVQVLLELGPLGLMLVLTALALIVRTMIRLPPTRLSAGLCGSLAAAMVSQFTEGGFIAAGSLMAFLFWFMAAAAVRLDSSRALSEAPVATG